MKKNIVIIILTILVLLLGGYLVYDKVIDKEEKVETKEEESKEDVVETESEEKDFDFVEAEKLIDKYYVYVLGESIFDKGYTEDNKKYIALKKIYPTSNPESIGYEDLNNSYKNLFGKSNELAKTEFNLYPDRVCGYYVYENNSNSFLYKNDDGCGGAIQDFDVYGIKSAKTIENQLIVEVVRMEFIAVVNDGSTIIYTDTLNNKYNETEIFGDVYSKENKEKFEENYIKENSDKLPVYTFSFEYEDDHYILKSMVKK